MSGTHRDAAEAVARAGGTAASRLGLRFDRVVVRLLDRLSDHAAAVAPEGLTALLAVTAPLRAPAKLTAALEAEIAALFQTEAVGSQRSLVLHDNRAGLRLVEPAPGRRLPLLGFVHNPDIDAALVLDLAERWLRSGG